MFAKLANAEVKKKHKSETNNVFVLLRRRQSRYQLETSAQRKKVWKKKTDIYAFVSTYKRSSAVSENTEMVSCYNRDLPPFPFCDPVPPPQSFPSLCPFFDFLFFLIFLILLVSYAVSPVDILVQALGQGVQRSQAGHGDVLVLCDLDGVADDGLDLERAAGLDVGQHVAVDALVGAGARLGAGELVAGLVLGDLGVAARLRDAHDLVHDLPHEVGPVRVGGREGRGVGGQEVRGVPRRRVHQHLAPAARLDVVVHQDRRAAALDQLHELAQLGGLGDGRGGEGADLEALEVAHARDAGRERGGGQVDDAGQDGVLREGGVPLVLDADAVLEEHDGGARAGDGGLDERRAGRVGAGEGLGAHEDEVPRRVDGRRLHAVDDGRADLQALAEDVAVEGEAVLADVLVVAAAHTGDVGAGARQDPGVD